MTSTGVTRQLDVRLSIMEHWKKSFDEGAEVAWSSKEAKAAIEDWPRHDWLRIKEREISPKLALSF